MVRRVFQVNKLIRVKPVKCRYQGEIGDVVVGRIVEVQQKRWKVELNSRFNGALLLASVNLPGGELRRKSIEDELAMREYLREGDLVSLQFILKCLRFYRMHAAYVEYLCMSCFSITSNSWCAVVILNIYFGYLWIGKQEIHNNVSWENSFLIIR